MSSNKLNDDFFETKRKYKENYKGNKISVYKIIRNLLITLLGIYLLNLFTKILNEKIEENKRNDIELIKKK